MSTTVRGGATAHVERQEMSSVRRPQESQAGGRGNHGDAEGMPGTASRASRASPGGSRSSNDWDAQDQGISGASAGRACARSMGLCVFHGSSSVYVGGGLFLKNCKPCFQTVRACGEISSSQHSAVAEPTAQTRTIASRPIGNLRLRRAVDGQRLTRAAITSMQQPASGMGTGNASGCRTTRGRRTPNVLSAPSREGGRTVA